jgi:hypothetical protein
VVGSKSLTVPSLAPAKIALAQKAEPMIKITGRFMAA